MSKRKLNVIKKAGAKQPMSLAAALPDMPQDAIPQPHLVPEIEAAEKSLEKLRKTNYTIEGMAKELGITEINVYPHKLELTEAKIGMDLVKDGRYPFLMLFEGDGDGVINLAVERPDGTEADTKISIHKVIHDTWNTELKHYKIHSRGFSGAVCVPAKRIIKCTAKKIYLLY